MSWLAASLVVLGLALVAGFAWYERSHPTARVLALVATLAALAALGRIAFAPLPNVKPTTDIVLLTGYALGGAPGFAVGAVAALASNVFFGQGPWTPWQMCAWGGVGVGGALLARAAGRELGRTRLAIACAVAGAGYGVVMNLHLWVTYSGDHSLAKLGAYFATSLPFDLAHVVGNVLFCLLFGPALVRALTRYRAALRGHLAPRARARRVRARRGRAARRGAAARRGGDADRAGSSSAQNRDGGFGGDRGQRSTGIYTSWAALGFAAAGRNPRDVERGGGRDVVAYVRAHPPSRSADIGDTDAHDPAAPRRRPRAADRQPRPRQGAARQAPAQRLLRQPRQLDRVRDLRPARRGPLAQRPRRPLRRALDRGPGQRRRRLQLRRQGRGLGDRRHRRRAAGARRRRPPRHADRPPRRALRRQAPEPRRRLPAPARRAVERAVDGVGDPGARRRRRNPDRLRRNGARSPVAYLRTLITPSGAVRYSRTSAQTPVWVTAAGARRARPQAVPARSGAAREAGRPRARRDAAAPAPTPRPEADPHRSRRDPAEPAATSPCREATSAPDARRSGPRGAGRRAHVAGYLTGVLMAPVA